MRPHRQPQGLRHVIDGRPKARPGTGRSSRKAFVPSRGRRATKGGFVRRREAWEPGGGLSICAPPERRASDSTTICRKHQPFHWQRPFRQSMRPSQPRPTNERMITRRKSTRCFSASSGQTTTAKALVTRNRAWPAQAALTIAAVAPEKVRVIAVKRRRWIHPSASERVSARVRRVRLPDAERDCWRGWIAGTWIGQLVDVLIRIGEACGAVTVIAALAIDRPCSGRRRSEKNGKRDRR